MDITFKFLLLISTISLFAGALLSNDSRMILTNFTIVFMTLISTVLIRFFWAGQLYKMIDKNQKKNDDLD